MANPNGNNQDKLDEMNHNNAPDNNMNSAENISENNVDNNMMDLFQVS